MEQYLENFKNCLQKQSPYCVSTCPFHLDIFDFMEKMKRGGFKGAFKSYRNAVGFPMIVSALCPEPCKTVCPGRESGGAIEMKLLERACIDFAGDKSPTDYNLPRKKRKVAIIGAGISGIACALRLCMKKYEVEIFEREGRIGGSLWELLQPELFLKDIEQQFQFEHYVLHLNTEIKTIEDLDGLGFDAVYAATGEGGGDFGLLQYPGKTRLDEIYPMKDRGEGRYCARYGETGWFAGGGLIGKKPIDALAGGLSMGTVIDNFLKTGKLLNPENEQQTQMCLNPSKIRFASSITAKGGVSYSEDEAREEAARCIECRCDFCRTYCDLTDYFNKWPLRIRDEILATTLPGSAEVKATPAKRLLSTCNQCGLCEETCPENINLGGLILAGRKSMHLQKKAPWVFHDFWLRDMEFSDSEQAAISKSPEHTSGYAFFPGCQLGASDPELVEKTYAYLLGKRKDVGLLLRCCGAPAEWSGDEERHQEKIAELRGLWESLGKPVLIMACPTCEKKFKTYMQDIPVISLYEILSAWSAEADFRGDAQRGGTSYSVFDACAARQEEKMKDSVRALAEKAGCRLVPLQENDTYGRCCGYGGQPAIANPDYAAFVAQKRISEGEYPYITYCINCRDIFRNAGKEAVHILELMFGDGERFHKLPTVSERRENRVRLKKKLLKTFWSEEMEEVSKSDRSNIQVIIPAEVADKLNRERILTEEVEAVIAFCERTGRKVWLQEKEAFSGYWEAGYMTCWVEYREGAESGSFVLINAYTHRMKIELEAVWNGRKTDADL